MTDTMGNTCYCFALLLFLAHSSLLPATVGQRAEFTVVWGGEQDETGGYLTRNTAGSVYVAGEAPTTLSRHNNMVLLKLTDEGDVLWQRKFETSYNVNVTAVSSSQDGHFWILGTTTDNSQHTWLLLKLDPEGNLLWKAGWKRSTLNLKAHSLAVDSQGNSLVTGSQQLDEGSGDAFLTKMDASGTLSWMKMWTGTLCSARCMVAVDTMDYIYVAGQGVDNSAGLLAKFNQNGDPLWQREIGTLWGIRALTTTPYGPVAIGPFGFCADYACADKIAGISILTFDNSGSILRQRSWVVGDLDTTPSAASSDELGNLYVTGRLTRTKSPSPDVFLLHINANGEILRQAGWGGQGYEVSTSISGDGETVYIAGTTSSSTHTLFLLRGQQGPLSIPVTSLSYSFRDIITTFLQPEGTIAPLDPPTSTHISYDLFILSASLKQTTPSPSPPTTPTTEPQTTTTTSPGPSPSGMSPSPTTTPAPVGLLAVMVTTTVILVVARRVHGKR